MVIENLGENASKTSSQPEKNKPNIQPQSLTSSLRPVSAFSQSSSKQGWDASPSTSPDHSSSKQGWGSGLPSLGRNLTSKPEPLEYGSKLSLFGLNPIHTTKLAPVDSTKSTYDYNYDVSPSGQAEKKEYKHTFGFNESHGSTAKSQQDESQEEIPDEVEENYDV